MCVTLCQLVHPEKQSAFTVAVNINYRCAAVVPLFLSPCESKASCGWERQWALLNNARNTDQLFGASLLLPCACAHKTEISMITVLSRCLRPEGVKISLTDLKVV